ncbi:Phosphoenolpyruvate carboxylase [Hyphomicrobium sulfonivorans]|uniref:Phosphoenolpyruvate carboxylase n=1 Tax=Hyphomicrobium sulfonivorans TaxID=121290 RepID=A0A120CXH2_HYPSL|nr:phosphoenolpyruvate carboxylase [Hyphomicrobium sulfonivorans]KWT70950.1 Phosphoenolpyruvate carboxylase [Hyphomicrobium sulfonivorans]
MQDEVLPTAGSGKLDEFKLRDELRALRKRIPDTPALNPIVNLAFDLSRQLENNDISFDDLKAIATRLMDRACVQRARHLRERVGFVDRSTTYQEFADFVEGAAAAADFDTFKQRWERARTGIVLTAHPTFGLSDELSKRIVEIAVADEFDPNTPIGVPHRPDDSIDLAYEHRRAQNAIQNLRNAYVELLDSFFSAAVHRFGDKAYTLHPKLATFACWVGYDLDGRTDISWRKSFILRLTEKRASLADIRERFFAIRDDLPTEGEAQRLSRQVTGKLDLTIAAVDEQIAALDKVMNGDAELAQAANIITRQDGYNITTVEPIVSLLRSLAEQLPDGSQKRSIAVLAGLMEATGLGTAHIHVRINAVQLNNAFRAFVHEPWTRDLSESQALARIVSMIEGACKETVNFESLDLETATAIRQFALIAQIKKHVDRETPVRFLIAETESPATVLIAIFFAKLFGVDDITDVSPLFETPLGLETGTRIIERLLEERAYVDYVRGRGRLSLQTGFSDAGRFVGQIAATLAIERMHNGIAEAIANSDVKGIETLVFSTHGESMGRGAHPGPMQSRLNYLFSDDVRRRFADNGIPLKHETSFQGGDGYLFFANRRLTTRALASVIMDGEVPGETNDPFYEDEDLRLDFLGRLRTYQEHLFAHPGYRSVLSAFGANILYKTGSRPVKRQMDASGAVDRSAVSRMRAIPNNAILQEFGYVANVVAGLGAAVGSERERFVELARNSQRLRTLIEMIARGKQLSSLNAMAANAKVFDPGYWAWRASWGREPNIEPAFRALAANLLSDDRNGEINGLVHHLRLDAVELHSLLEEIGIDAGKIPDDARLELDLLQAIRLALIMRVFVLAAQMPRFATHDGISHAQLFDLALMLDVPAVVSEMRKAFPRRAHERGDETQFGEKATYRPHGIDDYGRIETEILTPMEQSYDLIREIGTGISHHFGAFG